ncbi:MAG: capsule biosynthesis protein CapK [Sarcina sp.]|nr:capsule biosynthesis protein CapK [Sarcina sp.]
MSVDRAYPIDFVLPWVDGTDPAWREEKNKYSGEVSSSVHSFDYQDWGLLPYWFRCIEKNAPWVRNVYFVTWGHIPAWLNVNHPKLKIIKHTDYIPNKYLPTFSSHAIELNLHRIPGLSEHFVYFNDDMYLIRQVRPEFFFKNNLPCDCAVINPIAPANKNCIANLMTTTTGVINENFSKRQSIRKNPDKWINMRYFPLVLLNLMFIPWGRFVGLYESHLPTSMLKSTYEEVWKKEYDLLDHTCKHRFRDFKTDVNQWIMKEWQIASGRFSPRSIRAGKRFAVYNVDDAEKCAEIIEKQKAPMVCINDHITGSDYLEAAKVIRSAFEKKYSVKSSFEI